MRAAALSGLVQQASDRYDSIIDSWLHSEDLGEREAGITVAGSTGDTAYRDTLMRLLGRKDCESLLPALLDALSRLKVPALNDLVRPYLTHPQTSIRREAVRAYEIHDEETLREAIRLLGDASEEIRELARSKIEEAPYHSGQVLVECLSIPQRRVREGLFALLESLGIKELDVFRFSRSRIQAGYTYLAEAEAVRCLTDSPGRELLMDHLRQEKELQIENVLHVLAVQDPSGQMRIVFRGILSADPRRRANSLEALNDILDESLTRIILPLIESPSPSQTLDAGRKAFPIPKLDSDRGALFERLLTTHGWVTVVLALSLAQDPEEDGVPRERISELTSSENPHICRMAQRLLKGPMEPPSNKENAMETELTIPDKILLLKGIEIFEGLRVRELAAVASVTEEKDYQEGENVIQEGESGDTMYLIIRGEVSVIKGQEEGREIDLDRIHEGDYFGEMALFEDMPRSATIRTLTPIRLLVLHKQVFKEIVTEYPQIALHICKVLSGRIRKLHSRIKT